MPLLNLPTPPFSSPILIMGISIIVFLVVPLLTEKIKVPGIIGLIVIGAVIGPNALGWLERDVTFELLGKVGLLYIMFMAGLEIDLNDLQKSRNRTLTFGALTFTIPQVLGTLLGVYILDFGWPTSILLASMFASHTLVAYPVASRLGVAKDESVVVTVGGTIITDTAALLVLAVIAGSTQGELSAAFWITLAVSLTIYTVLVITCLPRLARWFLRTVSRERTAEFLFVIGAMLACAYLAELAGVEGIVGAFLAGLTLNRLIPEQSMLMNRINFTGNALFIPFFLISTGMLVDLQLLAADGRSWLVAGSMVGAGLITKGLAALITQKLFGYSNSQTGVIYGLSVNQAAATLAAVLVGYDLALFDDSVLNGTILMILVTCMTGPYITEIFGRRLAIESEKEVRQPGDAPHRILVPLANPETAEKLMDLAFIVRGHHTSEPVYPLTVVPGGPDANKQVARSEKILAHAVIHAAGAEVPTSPLTRVAANPVSGIVRAVVEQRITDIIIGWSGLRSSQSRAFSNLIDKLLERTEQMVMVAKISHPLNTSSHLYLVLPPLVDYLPGFPRAMQTVKLLASRLGLELHVIAVASSHARYKQAVERMRPSCRCHFYEIEDWKALGDMMRRRLVENDLVVAFSARKGALAWESSLERLPWYLNRIAKSFIVLYPADQVPVENDGIALGALFSSQRTILELPAMSDQQALAKLLGTTPTPMRDELLSKLMGNESVLSRESLPGALLMHAHTRIGGLEEPVVFVGVSPAGIRTANANSEQTAHVITILVSPGDHPPEEHLRLLSQLGRHFRRVPNARALAHVHSLHEFLEALGIIDLETSAEALALDQA